MKAEHRQIAYLANIKEPWVKSHPETCVCGHSAVSHELGHGTVNQGKGNWFCIRCAGCADYQQAGVLAG